MSSELPRGYRRVAESRIRENVGFGYDDFVIGMIIEHRPGRTVTETDNVLMATLTGNVAPIHTDAHYSSQTEWAQILVCSGVTLTIVAEMTVRSTSGLTIGNLGLDEVRFENPVFLGDTLYVETEILTRRRGCAYSRSIRSRTWRSRARSRRRCGITISSGVERLCRTSASSRADSRLVHSRACQLSGTSRNR
ncbi:MAG: MaoC family dehydratase [Pseudonocardiaceae bacterium]